MEDLRPAAVPMIQQERSLQYYWKSYKRPAGDKSDNNANTALLAGLLIGIVFFVLPILVVIFRRYVLR